MNLEDIPPQLNKFEYVYPHSNALVAFFLQKDRENAVCCAYVQLLPAA